jgi:ATPase subunit of ABC transporter with duplicated ATPase domains
VNGSGKSTLLKLIAGELKPGPGTIKTRGEVGYLPQTLTLGTRRTVSDLLGITAARDALHAIEAGDTDEDLYLTIGDDWDVEERARAWLDRLGLENLGLGDRVERLSGGKTIGVALAALFLRRPDVLLLDEPTNNLDLDARKRLYNAVASWTGVMVIVSHDRELLGLMDQIADLSGGEIRLYGGNLDAYEELLAAEQVAASGSLPRIVAHARKRAAQETAGKSRELHSERLEAARGRLDEAEQAVRDDAEIRPELPDTAVPAGRTILNLTGLADTSWHPASASRAMPLAPVPALERTDPDEAPVAALADFIIRGPERIALTGPNGAGKTTLLRVIAGLAERPGITVRLGAVTGYLPQRLDILDDSLSVVDEPTTTRRSCAPSASPAGSVSTATPAWPRSGPNDPSGWPARPESARLRGRLRVRGRCHWGMG